MYFVDDLTGFSHFTIFAAFVETSLYIPRAYHSALHIIGAQRLFADWMNLYSNSTYLTIYEYIACR